MQPTKEEIIFALKKRKYELSFYEFFKAAVQEVLEENVNWRFNWLYKYLCDYAQRDIERIAAGLPREHHAIINLAPRISKTLIFTVCLNAWAWINYSHLKFGTISYGADLALTGAYKTKLLIKSEWYQKQWSDVFQFRIDDESKGSYSNDQNGSRMSFGVVGSVVGQGFDMIVCDDLNKPREISDVKLKIVTDTFKDSIYTRLNDSEVGVIYNIQQRTHSMDLSGYILDNYKDEFNHICLPVEESNKISPSYLRDYYEDGLLHPTLFNRKVLASILKVIQSRNYSGQYLMNPIDEESSIIKKGWFNIIEKPEENILWHFFLDSAYGIKSKTTDPSGIILVGKHYNDIIISKAWKFNLAFPDLIKKIIELMTSYGSRGSKIYIEPKANGLSIIQQLKRSTKFNVIQLPSPKDSKEVRLNAIAPQVESGRVFLIKDSWNNSFKDEVSGFPVAAHDEYVDILGYSVEELLNKSKELNYYI